MKILVVGAGFLGSAIANSLSKSSHDVRVLSPRPSDQLDRSVDFRHGRLELGSELREHLDGVEVVVDAASSYVPATMHDSPAASIAASIGASAWLAERAVAHGVSCHIYLSSGGTVYGSGSPDHGHRESDKPEPISAYGAMKVAAEHTISSIAHASGTRAVHLRVANAFGPGQNLDRPQGIIGVAFKNHLQGVPTTIFGAREVTRDFVYIDDIVRLCHLIIASSLRGPVNAGSGAGVSLAQLLDTMTDVIGHELSVEREPARTFDVKHSVLDISLAQSIGWMPEVPLRRGLTDTWLWIREALSRE